MTKRLKYSIEILKPIVEVSISYSEVIRKLGQKLSGGLHSHLKRQIKKFGLDTSHFLGQAAMRGCISPTRKHWKSILILKESGRRTEAKQLRRALVESGRRYKCETCRVSDWNGKALSLQVDHKDRNWLNNCVGNLSFKCPNCHSQTVGWCGRKDNKCKNCGRVKKSTKSKLCGSCAQKNRITGRKRKVNNRPSLEILQKETKELGFCAVGRKYGVTDNAIRKWLRYYKNDSRIRNEMVDTSVLETGS